MTSLIGLQLGNYRLLSLVGQGGYADVYKAEHVHLQSAAAVKVLKVHLDATEHTNFLQEAKLVESLKHEHIVQMKEFGIEGSAPFLVLEFASNGTLRQRYPQGTILPVDVIVSLVKQIAAALHYAHTHNVIHRDIKPENILLGDNDNILLSDFGIAVMMQSRTQNVVGTVDYMAPEQFQGHPVPASDQYALAVLVYEWLCGSRPFTGTQKEVAQQHLYHYPPPMRDKVQGITPAIESVVFKALAKEPQKRYADIQSFAQALEQTCLSPNDLHMSFNVGVTTEPISPVHNPLWEQSSLVRHSRGGARVFGNFFGRLNAKDSFFMLTGAGIDVLASVMLGIFVAVLGLGELSWWIWLLSLVGSVTARRWYISTEEKLVHTLLGVLLSLYWCIAAGALVDAVESKVKLGCIPPAGVVAILVLMVSALVHFTYSRRQGF